MTSERPEAREPNSHESSPPADPDEMAEETSATGPRVPRLALVGGLVIGAVVAASLLMGGEGPVPSPAEPPERGVVCPLLRAASEQLEAGNATGFAESVRVAAREAELTLERSGQLFGRPEEVALRLRALADDLDEESARVLMKEARRACIRLGRWG